MTRKDPTEFRLRFAAWKNGELVYENGLPKYAGGTGPVDWRYWDNKQSTDYVIPFIEDKTVKLTNAGVATGAVLSTNLLDSIADNAERAGLDLLIALGLATKESTLGNPTDDRSAWNLSSGIRQQFNNKYPGTILHINNGKGVTEQHLINYHKGDNDPKIFSFGGLPDRQSILLTGFEFYKLHPDKYNPGLSNYYELVNKRGAEVMNSPEVKKWQKDRNIRKAVGRFGRVNPLLKESKFNLPKYATGTEGDILDVGEYRGFGGVLNFGKRAINKIGKYIKSGANQLIYDIMSDSGGSLGISHAIAGGANYTGSYIYPAKDKIHPLRNLSVYFGYTGKTKYGGDNADLNRDLVGLYLNRKNDVFPKEEIKKLRDDSYNVGDISYNGPVYEGKIYPVNNDSIYEFPLYAKKDIDSLIQNDRSYLVDLNYIRNDLDRRFPQLTLDNVRSARVKPIKNGNKYTLKATKIWDMNSPNIPGGSIVDWITKKVGGSPFLLEQTIPIKFVDKSHTDDWDLMKSTMVYDR